MAATVAAAEGGAAAVLEEGDPMARTVADVPLPLSAKAVR